MLVSVFVSLFLLLTPFLPALDFEVVLLRARIGISNVLNSLEFHSHSGQNCEEC